VLVQKIAVAPVSQSCNLRGWTALLTKPYENPNRAAGRRKGREKRRVTVSVEFGKERMTIEVVVPSDPDEGEVQKLAIARARDFARKFVMDPVR
jgi:hypothetical protein